MNGFERAARWVLFASGMLSSFEAGHLFYLERFAAGAACLVMTAVLLHYALAARFASAPEPPAEGRDDRALIRALALFAASQSVTALKGIGRSLPPSESEVSQTEDRIEDLFDRLGVPRSERTALKEEFERLRGKIRRNEGGRALIRSSRL